MKQGHFVEGLSNSARLMAGVAAVENRGAREAGILAVESDPGYGKSRTLLRLAVIKQQTALVRGKAAWTPLWATHDLASALGISVSRHRIKDAFSAVVQHLMERPHLLIVDEVNHATRNLKVIETLRDISDMTECTLVIAGNRGFIADIKPYPMIYDRIFQTVTFGPASFEDARLMCQQMTEVKIADDLIAEIHRRTNGKLRLVMNAIARVEAFGRKGRGTVTLADYAGRPLLNEDGDKR